MNVLKVTFAVASLMLASTAMAEKDMHMEIKIAIDDGSDAELLFLNLDSETMGFALHDMQVGEIQSVVDETGRAILITREENGVKFEVDGKTINMPVFDEGHDAIWIDDGDMGDIDVRVHRVGGFMGGDDSAGVMIISGKTIDDATQESIRTLLLSSGYDDDVDFISGSETDGQMHKTVIIKREITSTLQ
jgi:hypothetical protein